MTRKTTQQPSVRPGDYRRWLKKFDRLPFTHLLETLSTTEAEQIRTMLFAATLVPRQLTSEQVRRTWPQLGSRINLVDYIITFLAMRLKDKTSQINESTAALLNDAGIPPSRAAASEWTAEAVKKRRARARTHPVPSMFGPRFMLSRRSVELLKARQATRSSG